LLSKIIPSHEAEERNWKGYVCEYVLREWNVFRDAQVLVLWENEHVENDVSPENKGIDPHSLQERQLEAVPVGFKSHCFRVTKGFANGYTVVPAIN